MQDIYQRINTLNFWSNVNIIGWVFSIFLSVSIVYKMSVVLLASASTAIIFNLINLVMFLMRRRKVKIDIKVEDAPPAANRHTIEVYHDTKDLEDRPSTTLKRRFLY